MSDDVKISASGQHQAAVGEKLYVAAELALGTAGAFGYCFQFAQLGCIKGEDSIGFAQLNSLDNDGFCLVSSWIRHFCKQSFRGYYAWLLVLALALLCILPLQPEFL